MRIGINGMGRIGRLALRAIRERYPDTLHVVAINEPAPLEQIAHLLRRDTIYGRQFGAILIDSGSLILDGQRVKYLTRPLMAWWSEGVDLVLECAGGGPDGNKARRHLELGASAVLISSPAPNVDATLIMGVNEDDYDKEKHRVISMASCTANCVGPLVKIVKGEFGLLGAEFATINAYTNSQRLVDAPHRDLRCSAAAALNIIPSSSSAVPILQNLFPDVVIWGRAYRVPIACGSLALLRLTVDSVLPVPVITGIQTWLQSQATDIIGYSDEPMVSSDIIGDSHSAMIDGDQVEAKGRVLHISAWYDNEYAYACRLADMAMLIAGGR